jgi:hypothetical protein
MRLYVGNRYWKVFFRTPSGVEFFRVVQARDGRKAPDLALQEDLREFGPDRGVVFLRTEEV